jgi:hypothetical protein
VRVLLALVLAIAAASAAAEVRVRVVATDPPAEATLGRFEPFFVRIQFDADEPVSLWARPYRNGKPVDRGARTNPSAKHTGSGYALGWVEFTEATEVDEIRIRAGGGNPYRSGRSPLSVKLPDGPAPRHARSSPGSGSCSVRLTPHSGRLRRAGVRPASGDTALMSGLMPAMLGLLVGGSPRQRGRYGNGARLRRAAVHGGHGVRRAPDRGRHRATRLRTTCGCSSYMWGLRAWPSSACSRSR